MGFKRGSLVHHVKYGICYVGGSASNRVSLHSVEDGKRLTQYAKIEDLKFIAYNERRVQFLPSLIDRKNSNAV